MANKQIRGDISEKLQLGFDQARLKFLQKKAMQNGVVIISDMEGNVKQVPAKELLASTLKNRRKSNN